MLYVIYIHVCFYFILLFVCFAAKIPAYLYPFLEPTVNEKPLEFLRLTSLGVIGALVKIEDSNAPEVVHFLLETEVFPLCLRCIDLGDELTQSVAALIVMKILIQEEGLNYCCALAERFFSVVQVLGRLVERLPETPCLRLLRYVVRCYLRLSELPSSLRYTIITPLSDLHSPYIVPSSIYGSRWLVICTVSNDFSLILT
nr:cell differentiation protein RCD1 homolog [Ipomoea batatas]